MFIEKIRKAQTHWEAAGSIVAAVIIMAMMLLTTIDVVLRYVFNKPIPESLSISEFMLVGVIYFGAAYVQQRKGHVRVDMLINKVSGSTRVYVEIVMLTAALGVFTLLTWQSGMTFWKALISGDVAPGLFNYPLAPVKSVIPIAAGMLCLRLITDILENIAQLRTGSYAKSDGGWYRWIFLATGAGLLLLIPVFIFTPITAERELVGWIFMAIMVVLLLVGMPVAFAMLASGFVGFWALGGFGPALASMNSVMYLKVAQYTLTVIPLFIIMGYFAFHAGFAHDIYQTAGKWLGRIPGGLAQATVAGGGALGAACGSGIASCAILARVCIPSMRQTGINFRLTLGTVAAVGPIATMIPPSVSLVVYGIITEQSVAKLLIAGILPGITFCIVMAALIFVRCILNPNLAPLVKERISWPQRFIALKGTWGILMIGVIVMGGIYSGVFTPTEAGAIGAFGALVLGVSVGRIKLTNLKEALMETGKTTSMIFLIIATAFVYMHFLAISRIPTNVSVLLATSEAPRIYVLLGFLLFYLICGCFLDMLAVYFLTIPIIFPAMVALGYDPIWFGIIVVMMGEIGLITPPFGLNLFILKGLVPDASMEDIILGSAPFVVAYFITLALLIVFPQIALFLPSMMGS